MKLDYGMPTLIENKNLEETAALCVGFGLKFIELNMNLPQYQVEQLEKIDYLKKIADKNDLYFTIHLDENLNVCDFNHAVADAYMQTVHRAIEVAKKLQVPVLNMHMNHGVHFMLPDKKVLLFERYHDAYMASFRKLRKMCEESIGDENIRICIENTDGFRNYEKIAIDYLLQSEVFALTWDIGHSHVSEDVDEEFIKSHSEKLYHFHIHDSLGKQNHMTLGTGESDLAGRLQIAEEHRTDVLWRRSQ